MRAYLIAFLGFVLSACGAAVESTSATDNGLETLIALAPPGPLELSPYPKHYALDLTLDPRESSFGGTVTITLDVTQRSSGFYLHGRDLEVTEVRSQTQEGDSVEGLWQPVLDSGVAWLDYGQTVDPGTVTVAIDYNAPFDVNLSGLFKVTEQGDAYALAKSESIQARRFMPGFDQPAFKAPFDISLTIPETDSAISNAPEKSVESLGDGLKRVTFETTRPLPTYLLSLAVGSFDVVDAGVLPPNEVRSEPIPLRGFARRGKGDELALALEIAPELVRIFEDALQQPYPYKKLDIVAAPQWPSGATELAAAITYRESRILASPDIGPAARRSLLAIHAHEVGHMWFGNLVTPPWWDDLWLKEAFASWGEGASLSVMYPGEGYELDAVADGIRAMALDSLSTARAVREPIALNKNVRNAYDAITYNKGLSVIGMVDSYFGSDVFRPALGRYVEAYEDGVADSPEFFDIIGRETGEPDLTRAFRSFVEQNGLPLLTVKQVAPYDYIVKQSRYAPLGSEIEDDRTWIVPFCWVYGYGETRGRDCQLVSDDMQLFTIDFLDGAGANAPWVLPNAGGTGYYRFSLSERLWQDLGRNFAALTNAEQMVTLDSVGAEFAAGRVDVQTVWRFIDEAVRDDERRVVEAAIREAGRFERLAAQDPAALDGYRAAILDVFRDRYDSLAGTTGEGAEQAILKSSLERFLVQTGEDEALRADLAAAAATFIGLPGEKSQRKLNTDEYLSAMAVGMQVYGAPFLEQLLVARTQIDDPVFEQAVAYALGQNIDPELSPRILDLALSGALGSREAFTIVSGQMAQPVTRGDTWAWVQANFEAFVDVIPRQRKRATPGLAASLCSEASIEELKALFEQYSGLVEGYERSLNQTSERIALCAALDAGKGDEVRTFFKGEVK